jgi:transglutaminase-like putative cysteine protease
MRRGVDWSLLLAGAFSVLLAASSLSRVFTNLSYLSELLGAIAVAFAAGWVSRRLDVPSVLAPAVSVVALIEYLTLVYFREHAFAGLIPTKTVFGDAGKAVGTGLRDIRSLAAPVEPTAELVMITVAGVFAVAVIVDLLIFRTHRPVTAGLALLSLFIIPASLSPTGAGWLNFTLAAAGYLTLLTAEGRERVRRWGRRLAPDRAAADEMGAALPLFRVARGIGAAAIGLAVVVPGVVPGLGNGVLNGSSGSFGSGSGRGTGGTSLFVDPVVNIRQSLRSNEVFEVMQVRTGSPRPEYLRLAVLNSFNGQKWELGYNPVDGKRDAKAGELALPPGLESTTPVERFTAEIKVTSKYADSWLPAPYSLARLSGIKGKWYVHPQTGTAFSTSKKARNSTYDVESIVTRPIPSAVSVSNAYPSEVRPLASVPPGLIDDSVRRLAQDVTADAKSPWAKVVALQDYFARGDFTYSLDVAPGTSGNAIRQFLQRRIGYCEQFAGTMAVMVRAIGLPARVVVGFTPGRFVEGHWSITNKDLHAWPEVYFPGVGWTRFEPTPPQPGGGIGVPPYAVAPAPVLSGSPTPGATSGASVGPLTGPSSGLPGVQDPELRRGNNGLPLPLSDSSSSRWPVVLAILVVLLILPILPALARMALRRRQRARAATPGERAHVAWHHLEDDAGDLGYGWAASASPRVAARQLIDGARLTTAHAEAVQRLAHAEQVARYAPVAGSADGLDDDVATVRAALLAGVSRRTRLVAMLLPRSALRQVADGLADGYVSVLARRDKSVRSLRRRIGLGGARA